MYRTKARQHISLLGNTPWVTYTQTNQYTKERWHVLTLLESLVYDAKSTWYGLQSCCAPLKLLVCDRMWAQVCRRATCGCWRWWSNIFQNSNLERVGGLVVCTHTWSVMRVFLYLDKRKWKIWLYGWLASYQKSWKGWCSIKEFTFSKAGWYDSWTFYMNRDFECGWWMTVILVFVHCF